MIECCPECGSSDIESVQPESITGPILERNQNYRCDGCQLHFDTPAVREPESSRNAGRGGLTKKLVDANPEDWP